MERGISSQEERMRNWIADSFIGLSKHMRLDKISVSKLCQNCKISRGTFYYYFNDIPDLIFWIYQENVLGPMRSHLLSASLPPESVVLLPLAKMYNEKHFYCQMARQFGDSHLFTKILETTIDNCRILYERYLHEKGIHLESISDEQKKLLSYICEYFGTAHHQIILKWMKDGMPVNYEQLASVLDSITIEYFLNLIDRSIR